MKIKTCVAVVMASMLLGAASSALADRQLEGFDNLSFGSAFDVGTWSVYPDNTIRATEAGDPVFEGTGALVADYTPLVGDGLYIGNFIRGSEIDLSAEAAAGGSVSVMVWIGKDTDSSSLDFIRFSTAHSGPNFAWSAPAGATYDIGWNKLVVPLADFDDNGGDWSSIERIEFTTNAWPDGDPLDVVIDDLRAQIPEPTSVVLLALAGFGLLLVRRRK